MNFFFSFIILYLAFFLLAIVFHRKFRHTDLCCYCSHTTIPRHTSQNSIAAGNLEWILATLLWTEWTVTLCSFRAKKRNSFIQGVPSSLVEVTGFEPATSASRTQRSTKLSHTSLFRCLFLLCRSTQDILYYRDMEMSTGFFKKVAKSFFIDLNYYIVYFVYRIQTN